jgi:hypothetical protein
LAHLYLRKEDLPSARKWLTPLAQNASDPNISLQAQTLLDQIQQHEEQAALLEKARREAEREGEKERAAEAAWAKNRAEEGAGNQAGLPQLIRPEEGLGNRRRDKDRGQSNYTAVPARLTCSSCKKLAGILVATHCTKNGVEFVIKAGSRPWKFLVTDLENLFLFNVRGENLGSLTLRCGPISPSRSVVAEYRPAERETPEDPGKLINLTFAD